MEFCVSGGPRKEKDSDAAHEILVLANRIGQGAEHAMKILENLSDR
jgi:hypothetical protein